MSVIRDGGSVTSARGRRARGLAFAATFLLLTAGGVVTHPSLISAGSGTHTSGGSGGDDSSGNHDGGDDSGHHHGDDDCTSHDGHDDGHNGDGGHHDGNDDGKDDGKDDGSHDDGNDDGSHDSNDDNSGDHSGDDQANDGSSKDGSSDQSVSAATFNGSHPSNGGSDGTNSGDGSHDDGKDDDGNDDGSHHDGNDDGSHDGSHDDGNDDGNDDDDDCATATLILNKLVTNDDGGTATIADFTLKATSDTGTDVISGVDPDPSTAVGVQAKVDTAHTYVLSEAGPDGYEASAWDCSAGTLDGDTLTLAEGDVATCTITNDDTPTQPQTAIITVYKIVDNGPWGGTLQKSDFQLQIDGADVAQEVPVEVAPGTHTLSEVQRSGYQLAAIICVQHGTDTIVSTGESVDVVAGEAVDCVFGNAALPAMLTVRKFIDPRNGGDLTSSDFQLQIDGANVSQNEALALAAGTHTVGEVAVPGYQMVGISCSDDDTQTSVAYDNGVALALGQHVTCNVTNVADPVDLAITKVDDGQSHVAGGAPFDYTITVDNLGPRDASITDSVTVTDRLPAGLEFVTYPDTCTPSGQDLVCDIDPADLEVADPPVEIVVTVKAAASAAAGTYTNLAFVDTPDDPACVGTDCAPSCDTNSNNIACVDTDITRGATVTIDKSDNVDSVHPGDTYAYTVTVGNSGPSTMLDLAVTDDLPEGLILQSVSAAAPWSCNNADPVSCSYNEPLDPGDSAPAITINVKVDPAFLGTSIVNEASVVAVVTAKTALDPGTVSTAKDDETTPVVRSADLTIDKSVSKTTAAIGEEFDWVLDVTNHGPDTATNVAIHDAMPAAFQVKTVTPTGASCTNTASSVDCTIASLANGGTAKVVVHVVVVATATTGATSNTATVGSDTADPNSADNSDTASISVTPATASQAPVPPASGGSNSGSPSLPRTGNGSLGAPLTLAGLLLAGGMFSLVIARRRRAATAK